jgi:nicotinate-nucleotide adenylyltransferase
MTISPTIGLFGGTFDPIHFGHLRMALESKLALALDEMRLMPCHTPPHRQSPILSGKQRGKLLELALADSDELQVEYCELQRPHPSYTIDSISWLRRQGLHTNSITLLMGMDAFANITQWHQWWRLRELAHIAIVTRPGFQQPLQGPLKQWLATADEPAIIHQKPAGGIILLQQRALDISATDIRTQLASGRSPRYLLPEKVLTYIESNGLYCSEVNPCLKTYAENL